MEREGNEEGEGEREQELGMHINTEEFKDPNDILMPPEDHGSDQEHPNDRQGEIRSGRSGRSGQSGPDSQREQRRFEGAIYDSSSGQLSPPKDPDDYLPPAPVPGPLPARVKHSSVGQAGRESLTRSYRDGNKNVFETDVMKECLDFSTRSVSFAWHLVEQRHVH